MLSLSALATDKQLLVCFQAVAACWVLLEVHDPCLSARSMSPSMAIDRCSGKKKHFNECYTSKYYQASAKLLQMNWKAINSKWIKNIQKLSYCCTNWKCSILTSNASASAFQSLTRLITSCSFEVDGKMTGNALVSSTNVWSVSMVSWDLFEHIQNNKMQHYIIVVRIVTAGSNITIIWRHSNTQPVFNLKKPFSRLHGRCLATSRMATAFINFLDLPPLRMFELLEPNCNIQFNNVLGSSCWNVKAMKQHVQVY